MTPMEAPFFKAKPSRDVLEVMDVAALLGVREFDLFGLAWRRWSGTAADKRALETSFVGYMFHQRVPPWVRHFCREVLARQADGTFDPRAFGVEGGIRRAYPVRLDLLYVAGTVAVAFIIYVIVFRFGIEPVSSQALACEGGAGLRFFVGLAHALAARQSPDCAI